VRRKLQIRDEKVITMFCRQEGLDSFYHYFPLMYAISESGANLKIDENFDVWAGEKELYIEGEAVIEKPNEVKKVWVSLMKAPYGWRTELYDVNYVYDLAVTLQIKNLRKNVNKFIRNHKELSYARPPNPETALDIVGEWYKKSDRQKFTDFGYTMWLTRNHDAFKSLHPRLVCEGATPVAFSLWGELSENLAIHLICKDVGWPYLNDYVRYMTYSEMRDKDFELCNDGGDAGEHGIRVYKTKLRPKFIIPVYSWVRS